MRHGQQLTVQFLLADYRAAVQAVPALLRGAPTTNATSLPASFANDIHTAAKAHGPHGPAFARGRDRAFLTAYATDIAEVASALRRDIITLQDALVSDEVQVALAIDVGLAAQQVLAVVGIIRPRTMQRLLASSRANATRLSTSTGLLRMAERREARTPVTRARTLERLNLTTAAGEATLMPQTMTEDPQAGQDRAQTTATADVAWLACARRALGGSLPFSG